VEYLFLWNRETLLERKERGEGSLNVSMKKIKKERGGRLTCLLYTHVRGGLTKGKFAYSFLFLERGKVVMGTPESQGRGATSLGSCLGMTAERGTLFSIIVHAKGGREKGEQKI